MDFLLFSACVNPGESYLLLRSPARSLGFTILDEIFAYVTVF